MTALPGLPGPAGTPSDAPRLVVRGPDCLPAVVPHLLGFHPEDSVVVLGLEPGTHAVRVTLRLDLPAEPDRDAWAGLLPAFVRVGATEALLCVYPAAHADPWREGRARDLPARPVLEAAAAAFADGGVAALDAVCVVGDRMRSYWCRDETCCPREGRIVPHDELLRVEAEFVGAGSAPLASRRSLERLLDPRDDDDPFRREVLDEIEARAGDVAAYGPADVDSFLLGLRALAAGLDQPHLQASLVGMATSLVSWVRPRDLLMRALSVDADPALVRAARGVLVEAVRCARGPGVAPVASLLAVCAWLAGDGAMARVALERAESADTGYSLARLLSAALDAGIPPWVWASMMEEISEARILETGDGPPRWAPPGLAAWELGADGLVDDLLDDSFDDDALEDDALEDDQLGDETLDDVVDGRGPGGSGSEPL